MREKARILVVDDEPGIRKSLKDCLENDGYLVTTASSGAEALAAVEVHRPDLILLDVLMPEMNGLETLRKIRERDRVVRVIIITVLHSEQFARDAMENGANDCLPKPIDIDYLHFSILTQLAQQGRSYAEERGLS